MPSVAHAQKASALAEADLIRDTWPGVIVHFPFEEPWGGAELVCGEPMTTRATAREALEDWLFEHGSVFGPGSLGFEVTHVTEWQETRTFMRFTQNIEGLDAPESYGRALAHKNAGGDWSLSYVRCAALNVPQGGLPERLVGALQAKAIAATQSKAALEGLITDWTEPELILASGSAVFEPTDPREARQTWELTGRDLLGRVLAVQVRVDAVTGQIVAEDEVDFGFADDVSGTVTGLKLIGDEPYETSLSCVDFSISQDTTTIDVVGMLVQFADQPGGTTIASTWTDANGDYDFTGVTLTQDSVVRFVPTQEYFRLARDRGLTSIPFAPSTEVEPDALGIADFTYATTGGPSDEFRIGDITSWATVLSARDFYKVDNGYIQGIDDDDLIVAPNSDSGVLGTARFYPPGVHQGTQQPVISFRQENPAGSANKAYATIISHEYGHFALHEAFGVQGLDVQGLHEGYAEILSLLHNKPANDITGYASGGCVSATEPFHGNDWPSIEGDWVAANNCNSTSALRREQLVLAWREIRDLIFDPNDPDEIRELFVAWSFLATPEPSGTSRACYVPTAPQTDKYDLSARDATVYEVLVADDDDNSLSNGTPHDDEICTGFGTVDLPSEEVDYCNDSVRSGRCIVDYDDDGLFTVLDLALFETWIQVRDSRADINHDGMIDLFDHIEVLQHGMRCR